MTLPLSAPLFDEPMDPKDVRPWGITVTRDGGSDPYPMLAAGEDVASFSIGPSIEAIADGISIMSGNGYDPVRSGDTFLFYPAVNPLNQEDVLFEGAGIVAGIELTILTTATPQNTVRRTVGLTVRKR